MKKSLLLLAAVVGLSGAAMAQNATQAAPALGEQSITIGGRIEAQRRVPHSKLVISGSRFHIDGVRYSKREFLRDFAPAVPGLADQIRTANGLRWAALGVGCAGAGLVVCGGTLILWTNLVKSVDVFNHATGWATPFYTGVGLVALVIASTG